jgi:urease accessory protein UreF
VAAARGGGRERILATELLDAFTNLVMTGQRLGPVDPAVPARALATFLHAYAIGMVAADLDTTPASRGDLVNVITRTLSAFQTDAVRADAG